MESFYPIDDGLDQTIKWVKKNYPNFKKQNISTKNRILELYNCSMYISF